MSIPLRPRHIAAVGALSALLVGGLAGPASANAHPQLFDPAGDATDSLGINHPAIDILSSDVSTAGGNLVFTIHVLNLRGVDASTNRNYTQALSWGSTYATAETTAPGTAVFSDFAGDTSQFSIVGTSAYNTAKSTVTMTFSLAAVNAGGPDPFKIGTQTSIGNTVTAGVVVNREVVDAIQPSPTSYIVGQ